MGRGYQGKDNERVNYNKAVIFKGLSNDTGQQAHEL